MQYSDLSIDELLEIARTDSRLKDINLMVNDQNYLACIIKKYCRNNPYPTEMIRIHNILSEFSTIKNVDYIEIMYVFFYYIPENINRELFLIDFEQFITNSEVITQPRCNVKAIMYCADRIYDDILYANIIQIIFMNYPDFLFEKESYRYLFIRFFDNMHEEFAKIIIEILNITDIENILFTYGFDTWSCFNKRSDSEITSAITYLVDAGIKIQECQKISPQLLKNSIKRNYSILLNYLLSIGCRAPDKKPSSENNSIYKAMCANCLTTKEIYDLMTI